jgi:glycosyltransferase involved in cell wall biosynthesis
MQSPLVSIVVNNYNNEMYLSDCLDSLISQTYKNIEIVVVDAFSTDGSRTLLDYYQSLDSRIKLIYSDSYIKFPAISYNLGFLSCSGDFIAINDPDDISMPDRIQKQVTYLVNNPIVDVVGCNCIEFNDLITRKSVSSVENNLKNAAPPARNPSLMFRKILLAQHGMWRWRCEYAADFEWLYRWYINKVNFYIIQDFLLKYRYSHGGNISNSKSINQALKLAIFRTYFGLRLVFRGAGFRWWIRTLISYYYTISLALKFVVRKFRS